MRRQGAIPSGGPRVAQDNSPPGPHWRVTMRTTRRLLAASLLAFAACSAMAMVSRADHVASNRKTSASPTTHINIRTQKSFEAVTSAIEKQLGKYDGAAVAQAIAAKHASRRNRSQDPRHGRAAAVSCSSPFATTDSSVAQGQTGIRQAIRDRKSSVSPIEMTQEDHPRRRIRAVARAHLRGRRPAHPHRL